MSTQPNPTQPNPTPHSSAEGAVAKPHWDEEPIGAVANRTIFTGDNLNVLRGINDDTVDLIYLDPPFNSNKEYSAPVGSKAAGAAFHDTWTLDDVDIALHDLLERDHPIIHSAILGARETAGDSTMSYLLMMAPRLLEMRRVLKPTGAIFLHCDPTESHYLKQLMDAIFGRKMFRNEIIWCYAPQGGAPKRSFHRKHDVILYYASKDGPWNAPYGPMKETTRKAYSRKDENGRYYLEVKGKRTYLDENRGRPVPSWWDDIHSRGTTYSSKEWTKFPTQKPLALLERIISVSTNEGDVVLDPFCGCATAPVAAEKLNRRWIGIDLGRKAMELTQDRFESELGMQGSLAIHRTDQPYRTDVEHLPKPHTYKTVLWGEQEGFCAGCDQFFPISGHHIDHIVPTTKGGTDHKQNLQLLCGGCNSTKGDRPMEYLTYKVALRLKERGLTYGGKVDAVITEAEKDLPPETPDEVKEAMDEAWAETAGAAPSGIDKETIVAALKTVLAELAGRKS